jgi:hypothetical protein
MNNVENLDNNYIYKVSDAPSDEVLIYHHLGLGDVIICNGFINYLSSKKFEKIYLVIDEKFYKSIDYLYSENEKINLMPVNLKSVNNADEEVLKISRNTGMKPLKVGFSYLPGKRFYKAFYKQIKLPYRYSYSYFYQPRDLKREKKLYEHLLNYYDIKTGKYNIIHSQASNKTYDLNIKNNNDNVLIERESDIFQNMFLYNYLIENADEIHCVNSSFCHFVDRVKTNGSLYYHDIRGSRLQLKQNWKNVDYGN